MTYSNFERTKDTHTLICGWGWTTETTAVEGSFIRMSIPERETLRVEYDDDENYVEFNLDTETDIFIVLSRGAVYRLQYTQRKAIDDEGNECYDGWKWLIQRFHDGKYVHVFDFMTPDENVSFEFNSEWIMCNNQMWTRGK